MDAQELKERIIQKNKIIDILDALGMHSIEVKDKYITCGMPDGDNKKSTIVYKDNLHVEAYTRNIKDQYGSSDIISLVTYIRGTYFTQSIKWICDVCGFDYYGREEVGSRLADWVRKMWKASSSEYGEEEVIKPLNPKVLDYYKRYGNILFYEDGIDYQTQWEFGLGYDLANHVITIPIYDELGVLVGVKGRLFKREVSPNESKYFYLHPCPKAKILYGLHKTLPYIQEKNEVIVVESEKSVMQLWSMGVKNAVAISGHILSEVQVQKLTHLNVPIVIAYDQGAEIGKDGKVDKDFYPNEFKKFLPNQELYCIYDKGNKILMQKESPSDRREAWEVLYANKFRIA